MIEEWQYDRAIIPTSIVYAPPKNLGVIWVVRDDVECYAARPDNEVEGGQFVRCGRWLHTSNNEGLHDLAYQVNALVRDSENHEWVSSTNRFYICGDHFVMYLSGDEHFLDVDSYGNGIYNNQVRDQQIRRRR